MKSAATNHIDHLEPRRLFTAGLVDTNFSGDGLVDTNLPTLEHVLAPGGGKLIAVGTTEVPNALHLTLKKYKPDGSPDTSFGGGDGIAICTQAAIPWSALLLNDGKILVFADALPNDATGVMVRFNADGTLDQSFGGGDGVADPKTGIGVIHEMAQQPDGKVVGLGHYRTEGTQRAQAALYRYKDDGSLDETFYGGGRRVGIEMIGGWFSSYNNVYVSAMNLAIGPGGKIFASLDMYSGILGNEHSYVYRFTANGDTDLSMGTTLFFRPSGGFTDYIEDLQVLPDGKLLIAGKSAGKWAIWKLNWPAWWDLSGDSTFDGDGVVLDTFAATPTELFVRPDGKILVAGGSYNAATDKLFVHLVRYNSNGSIDGSFGAGGKTTTDFGTKLATFDVDVDADGAVGVASMFYANPESTYYIGKFTGDNDPPPPPPASGSIAGTLFKDTDVDGVKDSGETGLANWKVFLDTDKDGAPDSNEPSVTTDSSGNYKFTNLPAGTYRVREVTSSGWRRTSPSAGYHTVTLSAGQAVTGKHFGNTQNVLITGTIFSDLDVDGVRDPATDTKPAEPGLSGWKVFIDADKDGIFDAGEKTATTNSAGAYSFDKLPAGTYRVREVLNAGWRRTAPSSGYFDITLGNGASSTNKNFGNTQKVLISGSVFNDLDGDRIKDSAEAKLSGWRVFIDADSDGVFDSSEKSVLTDASGNFAFKDLAAGTYKVRVVTQSTWTRTTPTSGYFSITLAAGASSTGKLFGVKKIA
jgi:uncharacterized delta-60 repeat protein